MKLYLDLYKADVEWEYYDGEGTPPAEGGWQQSPSGSWRRPKGSGGGKKPADIQQKEPKKEAKVEEETDAKDKIEHAAHSALVSKEGQSTTGGHSLDSKDYSPDSDPMSHHKLAQFHAKTGNDEVAEFHRKLARERTKDFSPEEHSEFADKLKQEGIQDAADHHIMQAKKESEEKPELKESKDTKSSKEESKDTKGTKKEGTKKEDLSEAENKLNDIEEKERSSKLDELKENVQSHLDSGELSDEEEEKLTQIREVADDYDNLDPKEQNKVLAKLKKVSGKHGKEGAPKEGQTGGKGKKGKDKATNYRKLFETGRSAGESAGRAAEGPFSGGRLGAQTLTYAGQGVVSGGHSLLNSKDKEDSKPRQKGAEQKQSSMETSKAMLYLDLFKAEVPTTGKNTKDEKRAQIEHESSYAERPVGAMGGAGIVMEDDPDEGNNWKHDEDDSVYNKVDKLLEEEKRKREKDEEEKTDKSVDILKSINSSLNDYVRDNKLTDMECEFLTQVKGYSKEEVESGKCVIKGFERHQFNIWAHDRLGKSLSGLLGRV